MVVEGIERASQLDHLREHVHAPFAQGYLMYRPMPLDQLVKVIQENRSLPSAPVVLEAAAHSQAAADGAAAG